MDHYATPVSHSVGLLLSSDEERRMVRSIALECGLEPIELVTELDGADLGLDETDEASNPSPILAAIRQMQLIVTDGEWEKMHAVDLSLENAPIIIQLRDEMKMQVAPAWILHRPLRPDVLRGLLHQAIEANTIFARRHAFLLEELHRARRTFDSVCNGVTISDARQPDMPLVYVNPAFERMTGFTAHDVLGKNCRFLQGRATEQEGLTEVRRAIHEGKEARVLLKNYRKDGTLFWNELYLSPIRDFSGRITNFVGIQNDVTQQVESAQRLDYLAAHDYLTGLANRGSMMTQLKQALLRANRNGGKVAVLFFDLDNFKHVNDVYGHEAGDRLLQVVAARLRAETRGCEVVARLGGDEFVIVLEGFNGDRPLPAVVQRLTASLSEAVDFLDQPFHPSASVGMALYPRDGDTAEGLLKAADFDMYAAKHNARRQRQSDASRV